MSNYSRAGTGTTQTEQLGANANGKPLVIESLFGYTYWARGSNSQLLDTDIRTAETSQPISGLNYSSLLTILDFVVTTGGSFRIGESLQVTTALGVHKGNVVISDIIGNILYCTQLNGGQTAQTIINTDLIVLPADSIIAENGTAGPINSSAYPYFIYQTESTDVKVTFDTNLKKK